MTESVRLTLAEAEDLCVRALLASNVSEANARSTAKALLRAEADGQKGHGLSRIPSYSGQALSGKVDGLAVPSLSRPGTALLRVNAKSGFAYPAMDLAAETLPGIASVTGVASACIYNSHHLGQAGAHAERLANEGLVALVFSNSPKAINFWGGRGPMMGTNPIAFAAPRVDAEPLVIDLALSKVARGKILAAKNAGEKIPDSWALNADGNPTDDPAEAMQGSMLPIGDAKGAALVLMVELLAAALTGSNFGYEASSFFDAEGNSPGIGHTVVVFVPDMTSGGRFAERLENVITAIEHTDGARLPGTTRLEHRLRSAKNGMEIPSALYKDIEAIIESGRRNA
ncbi:MAG: Ldh family oxidoreductase [Gammaproteobacteria bacterium]|nr:Ldh family oxidoreductase [Gammaproteobacteria bacterium]NND46238.1 Ldh family oxidoreductase [Woeseiaceae bacterium]NNL46367.1 Ldh family oxidoreductase [Woeseiaceae bacterium]